MGTLTLQADRIPPELRRLPRWLGWRSVERLGKPKPAKVPVSPATGRPARVNDPRSAGSFAAAHELYRAGRCDGVGFLLVPADGIVGIDLDGCRDPETGRLESWAEAIVTALDSYAEVSPSGTGVRVFARGRLAADGRCRQGRIELYDRGRFLTVTGHVLPGVPVTLEDRPAEVASLQQSLGPRQPAVTTAPTARITPSRPDAEVLAKARAAANGTKVGRLLDGDWSEYPSRSEADLALCSALLYWTDGNEEWADRLFRSTGLMRPKWDHRRGDTTYGQRTLRTSLAALHNADSPPGCDAHPGQSAESQDLCLLYPLLRRSPDPGENDPLPGAALQLAAYRPDWDRLLIACGGESAAVVAAVGDALGRPRGGRFYLSAVLAGRLVGAGRTWGNTLLRRLVRRGVLEVVTVGGYATGRASEYRFVWQPADGL